jgi:hypothetical protein
MNGDFYSSVPRRNNCPNSGAICILPGRLSLPQKKEVSNSLSEMKFEKGLNWSKKAFTCNFIVRSITQLSDLSDITRTLKQTNALFICASAFEFLEKLADG